MHVIFSVIDKSDVDDVECDLDVVPRAAETVSFDTTIPAYRHERFIVQRVHHYPLGGPQRSSESYVFIELSKVD